MACIQDLHLEDIGTSIRITVEDTDESCNRVIVDLSSASVRQIIFRKPSGTKLTVTGALVTDGTDGKIEYITEAGDLDEVGEWKVQVYLVFPTGGWRSEIGTFRVNANL